MACLCVITTTSCRKELLITLHELVFLRVKKKDLSSLAAQSFVYFLYVKRYIKSLRLQN